MIRRGLIALAAAWMAMPDAAHAVCARPGDPDCVVSRLSMTGTIDFFATGASFGVNNDGDDRPDMARDIAEVEVPERRIPARATLVRALLYVGGSLFVRDMDGMDTPDMSVSVQVPGATIYTDVPAEEVYQSGAIPGFDEVILYTFRADITDVMKRAGGGMVGTYRVGNFASDIFDMNNEHTAANASFSIILIFEEPRLPPRTIALFDGLQEVLGSTVSFDLSGFSVSPVPSGSLTFYAQEGDCNPGPDDCATGNNLSGFERVKVIGADPARTLILSDPDNPSNDIFNRTINTVDPPLRDVPGTDIDAFDITPVLRAADTRLGVEMTTPLPNRSSGELIGLIYVIVGIDVFAPELRADSRIDISTERGEKLEEYFPGDPLRLDYKISNTGNLPGTEVRVIADLPALVTEYQIIGEPEGSMVTNEPNGGAFGRGRVTIDNLAVRHGEVSALVLLVETQCPLDAPKTLVLTASVSEAKEGGLPFTMTSSIALLARDRCGPRFFLFGGGGCSGVVARSHLPLASLLMLLIGFALSFSRSRRWLASLFLLLLVACSGNEDTEGDRPPPVVIGTACPDHEDMVQIPSIRGAPAYCIDRFEASISGGELGNETQPEDGDGSTTAIAESKRFVFPARGVTWFQARAACRNANKRLCTAEEWGLACSGEGDLTYPYGDEYEGTTCNGHDATRAGVVEAGAMIYGELSEGVNRALGCVTADGVYDMSGNVWEWNDTPYFDRARRGLVGGSFRSNRIGLRCITADNHAPPDEENDAFGFRCCL